MHDPIPPDHHPAPATEISRLNTLLADLRSELYDAVNRAHHQRQALEGRIAELDHRLNQLDQRVEFDCADRSEIRDLESQIADLRRGY